MNLKWAWARIRGREDHPPEKPSIVPRSIGNSLTRTVEEERDLQIDGTDRLIVRERVMKYETDKVENNGASPAQIIIGLMASIVYESLIDEIQGAVEKTEKGFEYRKFDK